MPNASGPQQKALGASGEYLAIQVRGKSTVAVQLHGTFTATVTFEVTVDGHTWVALNMTPSNSGTDASTATAAGAFRKDIGGYEAFRARCSAYTSGTINVFIQGGP